MPSTGSARDAARKLILSRPIAYLLMALRGCSQMCFQSNALTGVFFLAAIAIASPIAAAYTVIAALLAPAGRILLGDRGPVLQTGLPGLNPCLIAASLPTFFLTGWGNVGMWGVLIAAVITAIVLVRLLVAIVPLPIVALPFLIIFWVLWAIAPYTDILHRIESPMPTAASFDLLTAIPHGLGQALFSPTVLSGVLFLCGVLVSSWRHAVIALIGACIGTLVAYYYSDADPASVDMGLYGFNGVLAGIACYLFSGNRLQPAMLGSVLATMFIPLIADFGVLSLSAPFVIATWFVLLLGRVEITWMKPPLDHRESKE